MVSTRRSPIDNRYQWKFGRPAGCIRVYTANATPTQITTRRMVSHVDRVIRSSCLARTCSMSAVGLQASSRRTYDITGVPLAARHSRTSFCTTSSSAYAYRKASRRRGRLWRTQLRHHARVWPSASSITHSAAEVPSREALGPGTDLPATPHVGDPQKRLAASTGRGPINPHCRWCWSQMSSPTYRCGILNVHR